MIRFESWVDSARALRGIHKLALVLMACLCVFAVLFAYEYLRGYSSLYETFCFEWGPEEQDIVNGTLRIEGTFEWGKKYFNMTVRINDDDYYPGGDCLGLVFDKNNNSVIEPGFSDDVPYYLAAGNYSWYWKWAVHYGDGRLVTADCIPEIPSPFHTATFKENVGYTFKIFIPRGSLGKAQPDSPIIILFGDISIQMIKMNWVSARIER